jgi:putative transposase
MGNTYWGDMPWKKVLPMEEKMAFIIKVKEGVGSFAAICRQYGVSRRTGYKWWRRYQKGGLAGLEERSHRPHGCPHQSAPKWRDRIVALRLRHPSWGPKKLRIKLVERYGGKGMPVASTLGGMLKAKGLVRPRRRRTRAVVERGILTRPGWANEVWAVDFKGWFRTGDGLRCDPLTMSDLFSRYVLCCQVVARQSYRAVRPVFERMFARYGLPEVIRVDNGSPFASSGPGGLSRLSVWWVSLGIKPEFIEPGHPEQNGVHERMHRTLKAETTRPAAANGRAQQKRMERWRRQFNEKRPHEGIGQRVPADLYQPSERRYGGGKIEQKYSAEYAVRRVRSNGEIRWGGMRYVGQTLIGQRVGLRPIQAGRLGVWFGSRLMGELHEGESGGLRPVASTDPTGSKKAKVLPISTV